MWREEDGRKRHHCSAGEWIGLDILTFLCLGSQPRAEKNIPGVNFFRQRRSFSSIRKFHRKIEKVEMKLVREQKILDLISFLPRFYLDFNSFLAGSYLILILSLSCSCLVFASVSEEIEVFVKNCVCHTWVKKCVISFFPETIFDVRILTRCLNSVST